MLNTRLSVAIHLLTLVNSDPSRSSEKIAESVNTNPVVIRRISSSLKKAGILTSKVGVSGYTLAKAPADITLLDIYKAIDLEDELFAIHANTNPDCPIGRNIQQTLATTFDSINCAMEKELHSRTLQDFIETLQE